MSDFDATKNSIALRIMGQSTDSYQPLAQKYGPLLQSNGYRFDLPDAIPCNTIMCSNVFLTIGAGVAKGVGFHILSTLIDELIERFRNQSDETGLELHTAVQVGEENYILINTNEELKEVIDDLRYSA